MVSFRISPANRPATAELPRQRDGEAQQGQSAEGEQAASVDQIRAVSDAATQLIAAADTKHGQTRLARLRIANGTRRTSDGTHHFWLRQWYPESGTTVTYVISGHGYTQTQLMVIRDQDYDGTPVSERRVTTFSLGADEPVTFGLGRYDRAEGARPDMLDTSIVSRAPMQPLNVDQAGNLSRTLDGFTTQIVPLAEQAQASPSGAALRIGYAK